MRAFVAARVAQGLLVLLVVSFVVAFMLDFAAGDPAYSILGEQATDEQVSEVHAELGLDDPILVRYAGWLGDAIRGDLGTSYLTQRSTTDLIVERLPVTVELVVLALGMALIVAIPIGIATAHGADRAADRAWSMVASSLISVPSFVTALVLVYLFSLRWQVFPVTGWVPITESFGENMRHAFLPALTLALVLIPQFSRLLRADMIATLQEDYILAARARGISTTRILVRHALRPSSFSVVTLAGLSLGQLIGGAVIVETLFALPGIGQLLVDSIFTHDVTTVQGIVAFVAAVYVVANTGIDVLYGYLDPRVGSAGP